MCEKKNLNLKENSKKIEKFKSCDKTVFSKNKNFLCRKLNIERILIKNSRKL